MRFQSHIDPALEPATRGWFARVAALSILIAGAGASMLAGAPLLGITQNGNIYASDPATSTDTLVFASGKTYANGLAYDAVNQNIYYVDGTGGAGGQGPEFYVYSVTTGVETRIDVNGGAGGFGSLNGAVESASFYNGAYWYIRETDDTLYRVNFSSLGVVSSVTAFDDFDDPPGPGGEKLSSFDGGDISINNSGVLFLTSHNDQYGTLTISGSPGTPGTYTQISTGSVDGVQLAHDLSTGTLYGHSYGSGTWYTVNESTGALTTTGYTSANHFFDTASGPFVPEPSAFALVGLAGIGGWWCWRRRRKKQAAKPAAEQTVSG